MIYVFTESDYDDTLITDVVEGDTDPSTLRKEFGNYLWTLTPKERRKVDFVDWLVKNKGYKKVKYEQVRQ
jgi:hypothetical protein